MKYIKIAGCILLFIIIFNISSMPSKEIVYEKEYKTLEQIEEPKTVLIEVKRQVPELYPRLKRICSCESTGSPYNEPQQFDENGDILRGYINPSDTGMCQINKFYHEESAEKMGLDLETEYGNATYANWLFDTQGSTPWNWSISCWG